jgi:hypothetical protein
MRLVVILISVVMLAGSPTRSYADCPERPRCTGCGCKGGPGYRGPDGKCVGFKTLYKVCGNPPETRCTFENAPGTGTNRECALGSGRDKGKS